MMLVPLFSALAQTSGTRSEALMHRFLLIGVLMRGITTYSRGGFIALGVLGVSGLLRSHRKVRYVLAAATIAFLISTVMPQEFWDRMNTITATGEERDDSAAGRLHFWSVAVEMANAKPLTGVGFDGFSQAYESYNRDENYAGIRAVHSVWFALLADMGYPGLGLFVLVLLSSLWALWRVSATCRKDPERRDLAIYADALLTSLLVFAASGSFLSVQYGEMFWHFAGLSTALSLIARQSAAVAAPAAAPAVAPVTAAPSLARARAV